MLRRALVLVLAHLASSFSSTLWLCCSNGTWKAPFKFPASKYEKSEQKTAKICWVMFSVSARRQIRQKKRGFSFHLLSLSISSGGSFLQASNFSVFFMCFGTPTGAKHRVFPRSPMWTSGCLHLLTPHTWDKPSLPAAFFGSFMPLKVYCAIMNVTKQRPG